jgi:hypothetical protein
MFHDVVFSHRKVRAFLVAIERAGRGGAEGEWRPALLHLVASLADHFAVEEVPGGFFDRVRARVGEEEARELVADHRVLLGWLDRVALLLAHDDPALGETARDFAALLGAHERLEAGLALRCERAPEPGSRDAPPDR